MRKFGFYLVWLTSFQVQSLESLSFDWDDNVMTMVPEIVLIRNDTNEEVIVTTKAYAQLRHQVGEGKVYRRKPEDGSALDRILIENLYKTLELDPKSWQAPMWKSFQRALETAEGAAVTSIITGRRNSREAYLRVTEILKDRGFIKYVPRLEKIFPVGNKTLFPGGTDVSETKVIAMGRLLDELNDQPLNGEATHFWNFSDDDPENFRIAKEFLTEHKKKGLWPRVKVSVTFTGMEP